jgi:hypothetical protein
MEVEYAPDSLLADGSSTRVLTFKFPIETDQELTKITLETSNGTFKESASNSVTLDFIKLSDDEDYRVSEATLVASNVANDFKVKVKLQNYSKEIIIPAKVATVTDVALGSETFYISNDTIQVVNFEATLLSATGMASKGQPVMFTGPTSSGILSTTSGTANNEGKAKFQYVFTDIGYTGGPLVFEAIIDSAGVPKVSTKTIEVIP